MKKREIKIGKRTKKINIEVSPDLMEAFVMAIEKAKVEVIVEELSGEGIKSPVALKRFTSNSN